MLSWDLKSYRIYLVDVIEGNCRMKQALIRDKRYDNLYLLPSAQTKDKVCNLSTADEKTDGRIKRRICITYFWIVLPELNKDFKMQIAGADHAVIVTTPEVSAIRDADRIIGLLEKIR